MRARFALVFTLAALSMPLYAEDVVQPSVELLEFLGNWEDAQGNWVDPLTLELAAQSGEEIHNGTGQNEAGNEQTND